MCDRDGKQYGERDGKCESRERQKSSSQTRDINEKEKRRMEKVKDGGKRIK